MVGSIMVIDTSKLFHSIYDLKATQMNMQCKLIWELMLYKFRMGYNAAEAIKIIYCVKLKAQLITVQKSDNLRNFAQIVRTSMITPS